MNFIIFFTIVNILTEIFIITVLIVNIYVVIPKIKPINIKSLILPSVNLYMQNIILIPANIQKIMSSIFVIKLIVLNDFLNILKKSKRIPIKIPFIVKTMNKYAWLIVNFISPI